MHNPLVISAFDCIYTFCFPSSPLKFCWNELKYFSNLRDFYLYKFYKFVIIKYSKRKENGINLDFKGNNVLPYLLQVFFFSFLRNNRLQSESQGTQPSLVHPCVPFFFFPPPNSHSSGAGVHPSWDCNYVFPMYVCSHKNIKYFNFSTTVSCYMNSFQLAFLKNSECMLSRFIHMEIFKVFQNDLFSLIKFRIKILLSKI